jgi:hypothetical protein
MGADWPVSGLEYGYLVARGTKPESGPLLYKEDILPVIRRKHREFYHLCGHCLRESAPAAFAAITSGQQCEYPKCGSAPDRRCLCCRGSFCRAHVPREKKSRIPYVNQQWVTQQVAKIGENGYGVPYNLSLFGFCEMCAFEQAAEARRLIRGRAQSYHVRLDGHQGYQSQVALLFRASEELRQWREKMIMKRFRGMVEEVIRAAETNPGPCCRDNYFGHKRRRRIGIMAPADSDSTRFTYQVVDRRTPDPDPDPDLDVPDFLR